jgi:exonuclease III
MKIATFNVNGVNGRLPVRHDAAAHRVGRAGPT